MKLVIKNNDTVANKRLNIYKKEVPCLDTAWHYHAEYELLYITKSHGIRFVGDSVSHFEPGDLVLVGSYLPHLWRNDVSFYKKQKKTKKKPVETIVTKFTLDFVGENTFNIPEFSSINKLFEESKFGVCFGKEIISKLNKDIIDLVTLSPAQQSISLLGILYELSITTDKTLLSSSDMRQYTGENSHRIDNVLRFISDNYATDMSLQDVSDVACMTTNSFCRFFKKMTNKSFTQFLNEVRIRNASRLLVQGDVSVSSVCYAVGYNSITNFNKQFKQIMGSTPKDYREAI